MYIKFEDFPVEIFEKIYSYAISIEECDLKNNINLRLVCKYWNNKILKDIFWKLYTKELILNKYSDISLNNIYSQFYSVSQNKKISYYIFYKNKLIDVANNIMKSESIYKNEMLIIEHFLVKKYYLNSDFIILVQTEMYLYKNLCSSLLDFCVNNNFNIINIPVCYFKNSNCVNNICGIKCSNNYHGLLDYVNHYISRGIDDLGRFYILFFYKNYKKNKIYYEFIYQEEFNINNIPTKILTYSGYNNICFIGNLSYYNDLVLPYFKRRIKNKSFNYIKRLLNFNLCGIVEYCQKDKKYYEYETIYSDNEDDESQYLEVSLYFNRNEIKKNIKYNQYVYY